jgi:hypothetical protein
VDVLFIRRADENDHDMPEIEVHLESAAGVAAIQVGHHDVEEDELRTLLAGKHESVGASVGLQNLESRVIENLGDQRGDSRLVVDDENSPLLPQMLVQRDSPSPVRTISELV